MLMRKFSLRVDLGSESGEQKPVLNFEADKMPRKGGA